MFYCWMPGLSFFVLLTWFGCCAFNCRIGTSCQERFTVGVRVRFLIYTLHNILAISMKKMWFVQLFCLLISLEGIWPSFNLSTFSSSYWVLVVIISVTLLCLKVHGHTLEFGEVNEQHVSWIWRPCISAWKITWLFVRSNKQQLTKKLFFTVPPISVLIFVEKTSNRRGWIINSEYTNTSQSRMAEGGKIHQCSPTTNRVGMYSL